MTNHNEETTEHQVLAALRSIEPRKRAELLAVIEAMAIAFPRAATAPKRTASLSLVVADGNVVRTRKSASHDQQRVLPTVSLRAVFTK